MNPERTAFDECLASHYEAWYQTPAGQRADMLEKSVLHRLLKRFPDAHSVLEIGAGTGHFTRWLRAEGFAALGLDVSAAMLRQARKLDNVTLVQGDACQLPFAPGAFDLVAFITTLEFLSYPRHALREALRVSRQGLLLGVLNRWSPLGIERWLKGLFQPSIYNEAHFYSVKELERLLGSLVDKSPKLIWETTLLPRWVDKCLPHIGTDQPWGGFIAMALLR